jgi:hypothetical protein
VVARLRRARLVKGNIVNVENLAGTVRSALAKIGRVHEVKMFGGIGFMLNGNLLAAAVTTRPTDSRR